MKDPKTFWNTAYQNGKDYRLITSAELTDLLDKAAVESGKVLDIGSGTGQLTRELYHRGFDVTGIEVSPEAISRAQAASKYVNYLEIDLEHDTGELKLSSYDLITCKLVFAFIKNKEQFLGNLYKLLSGNGVLVIITPTHKQVEENKRGIAVNLQETLDILNSHFTTTEHYEYEGSTTFIAKK